MTEVNTDQVIRRYTPPSFLTQENASTTSVPKSIPFFPRQQEAPTVPSQKSNLSHAEGLRRDLELISSSIQVEYPLRCKYVWERRVIEFTMEKNNYCKYNRAIYEDPQTLYRIVVKPHLSKKTPWRTIFFFQQISGNDSTYIKLTKFLSNLNNPKRSCYNVAKNAKKLKTHEDHLEQEELPALENNSSMNQERSSDHPWKILLSNIANSVDGAIKIQHDASLDHRFNLKPMTVDDFESLERYVDTNCEQLKASMREQKVEFQLNIQKNISDIEENLAKLHQKQFDIESRKLKLTMMLSSDKNPPETVLELNDRKALLCEEMRAFNEDRHQIKCRAMNYAPQYMEAIEILKEF
jgi:hypothetical protein